MRTVKFQKINYKVAQSFVHEHVVQAIGSHIALSARQAQHLLLGGFIVLAEAENTQAANNKQSKKGSV